ncbi:unnamed protein product [Ectocarpus sp. 13 AM-2016]
MNRQQQLSRGASPEAVFAKRRGEIPYQIYFEVRYDDSQPRIPSFLLYLPISLSLAPLLFAFDARESKSDRSRTRRARERGSIRCCAIYIPFLLLRAFVANFASGMLSQPLVVPQAPGQWRGPVPKKFGTAPLRPAVGSGTFCCGRVPL